LTALWQYPVWVLLCEQCSAGAIYSRVNKALGAICQGAMRAQSPSSGLAGALIPLQRINSVPISSRADPGTGSEGRLGLLAKGSPGAVTGCVCPRPEAWAVDPLLASQSVCCVRCAGPRVRSGRREGTEQGARAAGSTPSASSPALAWMPA